MHDSYKSRKFIISVSSIIGAVVLGYYGKMTPDIALVMATAIGSYNFANAMGKGK